MVGALTPKRCCFTTITSRSGVSATTLTQSGASTTTRSMRRPVLGFSRSSKVVVKIRYSVPFRTPWRGQGLGSGIALPPAPSLADMGSR